MNEEKNTKPNHMGKDELEFLSTHQPIDPASLTPEEKKVIERMGGWEKSTLLPEEYYDHGEE